MHVCDAELLLSANVIYYSRWFYWTDYGTDTIERASMDGNSRMILHSTNLRDTYAITIDYENQFLYWADYTLNRIERSNVDGTNRMILTTSIRDPSSISYYNGRLYWGDYAFNRVLNGRAGSPGSGTYIGGGVSYDVYGIQVVSKDLQPLRELSVTAVYEFITFCTKCRLQSLSGRQWKLHSHLSLKFNISGGLWL